MKNDSFIEKRKLSFKEYVIVLLLEDFASHGISHQIEDYSIGLSYLGKRGVFRTLHNNDETILVGRRHPPRIRQKQDDMKSEYFYYIIF